LAKQVTKDLKGSEIVHLEGEDVQVWPGYCTRPKRNCAQCQLEGKLQCHPNHRHTATLSQEEKAAIAHEAKQRGVLTVATEKGIPMFEVRAWVGAYCRGAKRPKTLEPGYEPKGLRALGRPVQGQLNHCLLCGMEFYIRPYRLKNGSPQYCTPCTRTVLPALRSGNCPDCKTKLEVCAATRELRCGKCEKTWSVFAVFGSIAELFQGGIKRIKELELELDERNNKLAEAHREIDRLRQYPAPVALIREVHKQSAKFMIEIASTLMADEKCDPNVAIMDTKFDFFDSLDALLVNWIGLFMDDQDSFNKGVVFAFEMLKLLLDCQRFLEERIRATTTILANH